MTNQQQSGFTLIEAMILAVILSVAIGGLMSTQTRLILSDEEKEETIIAMQACEDMAEVLRDEAVNNFYQLFDTYKNGSTSGKDNFIVNGLSVQTDDPDGKCGRIEFPETNGLLDEAHADTDWDSVILDMDCDPTTTITNPGIPLDDMNSTVKVLQARVSVQYKSVTGAAREQKIIVTLYGTN